MKPERSRDRPARAMELHKERAAQHFLIVSRAVRELLPLQDASVVLTALPGISIEHASFQMAFTSTRSLSFSQDRLRMLTLWWSRIRKA